MGQIQSIEEFLSLMLRRRWLIILIAVSGLLISAIYAKTRPDTYMAAAVIQVEVPTVSGSSESTAPAPSGAAQLLQAIKQRLTTRENLLAMIERHQLFTNLPGLSTDEKIALLRGSVTFEDVASAAGDTFGQPKTISALIVYAELDDPELAARVANDFAQGILDQTSAGQQTRAVQNVTFFREEEARIWQQITDLEAEITAYTNTHDDKLPALNEARRDELVGLDTDIRSSGQQKLALVSQKTLISASETLRETDRRLLDQLTAQIGVLDAQISALTTRRTEIEAALLATPEIEQALDGFDRRLQQLQGQYDVANQRMAEAETAQRLAERHHAERFTLLERAITPEYSRRSGGKKLVIAGSIASLLLGIAVAFVLDLLRPVVRTAAQMERQLDLLPIISIPEIERPRQQIGKGLIKLLDDPIKSLLGIPRFAVLAATATLLLIIAAAAIS